MDSSRVLLGVAVWAALVGAGACKEPATPEAVPYDAGRRRRLFQPPAGEVRAVPPHAIHANGVGPYALGRSLRDVLGMLSRGPRVMLMQIDGVVDYSLVRAESDSLIIGVEPLGGVAFVSVLDAETARTESGIGVGTGSARLAEVLGPPLAAPALVLPPRIAAFASLPNVRFLLDEPGGSVAAVVVRGAQEPGEDADAAVAAPVEPQDAGVTSAGAGAACLDGGDLVGHMDEIVRAAEVTRAEVDASLRFGCFSAAAPEALVYTGDRVVAVGSTAGTEPAAVRRLAVYPAAGISFAAPIDVDGDGRSEVAVVKQREAEGERRVDVELLRLDGSRFVPVATAEVYRLSERNSAWVGAQLDEIELQVELQAVAGDVVASGLYVHHGQGGLDTVAPLVPTIIEVRRKKPGTAGAAAEVPAPKPRGNVPRPGPGTAGPVEAEPGRGKPGNERPGAAPGERRRADDAGPP
jgi:hypothetical protein